MKSTLSVIGKFLPNLIEATNKISASSATNIDSFFTSLSKGLDKLAENKDIIKNLDNLEKKLLETCNLTENMKIYIEYYRSLA